MIIKYFTIEEIKKHNNEKNAWIIINNNVYDITEFIDNHPGGPIIKQGIGKNATDLFLEAGHSEEHLEFLNHYLIGQFKTS